MPEVALAAAAIVTAAAMLLALLTILAERRARRMALTAQAGFAGLMDATGFGVLMTDGNGLISYANGSAVDILGYPESALIGRDKHRLLHAFDPGETGECPLRVSLRERRPYFGQENFIDIRGNLVPVSVSSAPIAAEEGSILVFRDRSTEVAEERQRDETFALISHELRSPLTTVVGFSNRLHRAVEAGRLAVDEQRAEEIALLASEAGRMRDIVTVVLDVANLDRRMDVQLEPISLRRVVDDEVESVRRDHPSADFNVGGDTDVVVEADERYVRRILENLLENAVKYGGVQAPIDVMVREEDGGIAVVVRDHGPGIAREALPHVFDRFYRQETTAGRRPGLGLGLYLSRRLAGRLGGRLSVASEVGAGAEFTLWLPFEPSAAEPEAPPSGAQRLQLGNQVPRVERLID